jgi:uncharacterized protein YkwD
MALCAFISLGGIAQMSTKNTGEVKNFRKDTRYQEQIDLNNVNYKLLAEVIFHLTNEIRIKNKLEPLTYSDELSMAATMHAHDMVKYDFFSHFNEKEESKKTPNDRARLCKIVNPALAENIIEGYGLKYQSNHSVFLRGKGKFSETPNGEIIPPHTYLSFGEVQLTGWMNSKDHRNNILAKEALQIGIGAASFVNKSFNDMPTFYVVQNFQLYNPVKKQD